MTRRVVVPFRRHTKSSLDGLLARVAPESRGFAAELLCIRTHDHRDGGCIGAPASYAPQPVRHRFADDLRDAANGALTTAGFVGCLLAWYGLAAVAR